MRISLVFTVYLLLAQILSQLSSRIAYNTSIFLRVFQNMCSQCYDGASNMTGAKKEVAKQIQNVEKQEIFIHCYGHALNLACSDVIKRCKVLKSALETT